MNALVAMTYFRTRRTTIAVTIFLSYLVLSLFLFAPVLPHFTTAIILGSPSAEQDGWQNVWNLWWVQYALLHGANPFYTTMLYYPTGVDLFWQTVDVPHGVLALPISTLVNPIAAYNTLALLAFVTSASAMYLAAWRLTGSLSGAWIAGFLFAFAPFHMTKLFDGNLDLLSTQYIPLFVLGLVYAFDNRSWRASIASAILLAIITLTCLYYGLFSLIYIGLYALLTVLHRPNARTLATVSMHGLAIVAPIGCIIAPQLLGSGAGAGLDDWQERQILHAATPLDFVLPNPYSPLWGESILAFQRSLHSNVSGFVVSGGIIVLVLAGVSLVRCFDQVWRWLALSVAVLVLALGPYLVLNGTVTRVPLPFLLLDQLPAVKLGQRPNQIIVFSSVLLALMASYGWAALTHRLSTLRQRWLFGLIVVGMVVELWPSGLTRSDFTVAPFYATVPRSEQGALLELPYQPDSSAYMKAQTAHQRPIMGGYLARTPGYAFADQTEGIRQFWLPNQPPQALQTILYPNWTDAITPTLASYDIAYVVVHLDARPKLPPALIQALATQLQQVYRDPTMVAYQRPVDAPSLPLINLRGDGWYALEQEANVRWQWTADHADITVTNPGNGPRAALLGFDCSAFRSGHTVQLYELQGATPRLVGTFSVPALPSARSYQIALTIAPGETSLRFVTHSEPSGGGMSRRLGLRFTRITLRFP